MEKKPTEVGSVRSHGVNPGIRLPVVVVSPQEAVLSAAGHEATGLSDEGRLDVPWKPGDLMDQLVILKD